MNILILGATSAIGTAIAAQFASGNHLILSGRDLITLQHVQNEILKNGAKQVRVMVSDLASGYENVLESLGSTEVNLLVNAASSTSRVYDSHLELVQLKNYLYTDLIAPVQLIEKLIQKQKNIHVIFISTILAKLNNPDRQLYGSLKKLQKLLLDILESNYPTQIKAHTFFVGERIPDDAGALRVKQVAKKIRKAYLCGKRDASSGFAGHILFVLYKVHPTLSGVLVCMSRCLRNIRMRGRG